MKKTTDVKKTANLKPDLKKTPNVKPSELKNATFPIGKKKRSLSPPRLISPYHSSSIKSDSKYAKMAPKGKIAPPPAAPMIPPVSNIKKSTVPIPTKSSVDKRNGILQTSDLSFSDEGIYMKGEPPSTKPVGKFVIPKILLESRHGKAQDFSERAVDLPNYLMVAKDYETSITQRGGGSQRSLIDGKNNKSDPVYSKIRAKVGKPAKGGKSNRMSDASIKSRLSDGGSGSGNANAKKRRRWVRHLLLSEEFGEPACCPRCGILLGIWILLIAVVALISKYALNVTMPEPSIVDHDNNTFFVKVYLKNSNDCTG